MGNSLGFVSGISQSEINFNSYMFDGSSNTIRRINAGPAFRFSHTLNGLSFQAASYNSSNTNISFANALTILPNANIGIGVSYPTEVWM